MAKVTRWDLCPPGVMGESRNGAWMDYAEHAALAKQARALAEYVKGMPHEKFACASNRDILDGGAVGCDCVKRLAQAVLDATEE